MSNEEIVYVIVTNPVFYIPLILFIILYFWICSD